MNLRMIAPSLLRTKSGPRVILEVLRHFKTIFTSELSRLFYGKFNPCAMPEQACYSGEVRNWVITLALSLSAEAINCTNVAELYAAAKCSALDDLHLELLPRTR